MSSIRARLAAWPELVAKNNKGENAMLVGCPTGCVCSRYGHKDLVKVLPTLINLEAVTDGSYKRGTHSWGVVFLADNLKGNLHTRGASDGVSEAKESNYAEEQAITFAMRSSGKSDLIVWNDQRGIVDKVGRACSGEADLVAGVRHAEWQALSRNRTVRIKVLRRTAHNLPPEIKRAHTHAHNLARAERKAIRKGENHALYTRVRKPSGEIVEEWAELEVRLHRKDGTTDVYPIDPQSALEHARFVRAGGGVIKQGRSYPKSPLGRTFVRLRCVPTATQGMMLIAELYIHTQE